jgi:O-acetyl-ADP-ribose deacetylase (regulator of RNase III)
MKISLFAGDVSAAPAEALCASTNPRLSLVMGTGASIRSRGGFEILRACEAIVGADEQRSGSRGLAAGSVHATTAGQLPAKIVVHCVASDNAHHSSAAIIRSCVTGALAAADAAGCASIAMPLFGTGHARFKIENAVVAMAEALRDAITSVRHVIVVVHDAEDVSDAVRVMRSAIPNCEIDVVDGPLNAAERRGLRSSAWGEHDEI